MKITTFVTKAEAASIVMEKIKGNMYGIKNIVVEVVIVEDDSDQKNWTVIDNLEQE